MPTYELPDLTYDYAALEPHLSAQIMELHHDKHHAAYVKGANTTLENLEQATIAAVNGHAVGGGWGLALACDFRIAAAEAQFWIPEVDLGVPLGIGTTTRFVRMLGPARAKEIIMGGARYSAADAQAWGLVNRAVPGADLAAAVRDYAGLLATKPFRPLAEVKARLAGQSETR